MNDPQNPNTPLLGRYQTLSELAKSPIGGLFMALDVPERRVVALRSLPAESKLVADDVAQLLEAGRWVKGLDDSAIMKPLDIGVQEGFLHAAYQYDISEPLRGVLRLASFKGHAIPLALVLRVAYDTVLAARAIEACGASPTLGESLCGGLIPDSILIGRDGTSRVCDAGIAAVLRRTREYGQQVELLSYAAPEQLEPGGRADSRSDVFTIGVLLWEMLTNRRLFGAQDASEVIDKVRHFDVPPLDSAQRGTAEPIPDAVTQLVKRALEREPAQRYAGTTALLQALETHANSLLAAPAEVGAYVAGLVENIFETRLRAIERARGQNEIEEPAIKSAIAPKSVAAVPKNLELLPRAATTKTPKSSPKNLAPIPPPPPRTVRSLTTPKPSVSPLAPMLPPPSAAPPPQRPTFKSNPPMIAALVDDAIAQGAREAEKTGSIHPTIPPPVTSLQAVFPSVPTVFELPGAELFATPGLPSVRPAPVAQRASDSASVEPAKPTPLDDTAALAKSEGPKTDENCEPQDAAQQEPVALESALEGEAEVRPALGWRAKRPRMGIALLSLVVVAFIIGSAMRRCADRKLSATATRSESTNSRRAADAGATGANSGAVLAATPPAASALDAGQLQDTTPANVVDAGPGTSTSPKKVAAPVHHRKTTAAPRYNSKATRDNAKVTRGRGKTTR